MAKGEQKVYWPLMIGDWLKGTRGMKAEVRGVYISLLLYQWDNGYIPSDIDELCLIDPELPKVWAKLREKFVPISPDKLQNKKNEEVREFWAKQKKNGQKGGRPTKDGKPKPQPKVKPKSLASDNPNHNPDHNLHNDLDLDIDLNSDFDLELEPNGKFENFFHGPVPQDIRDLAAGLPRSSADSEKWQRQIATKLTYLGYQVDVDNVVCPYPDQHGEEIDGWIDLRATKGKDVVCIECDNRVVTQKSFAKITAYAKLVDPSKHRYSGVILLKDKYPDDVEEQPNVSATAKSNPWKAEPEPDFNQPDTPGEELIFPIDTKQAREQWANWKKYRWRQHGIRYATMGEQADLKRLEGMTFEEMQKTILKAIAGTWRNLYPDERKRSKESISKNDRTEFNHNEFSIIAGHIKKP